MIRHLAALAVLSLAVGCAEKLTGPDAQAAAREYQSKTVAASGMPLVFVDGKEISVDSMRKFPSERIESVEVLKGKRVLEAYGTRGVNGVINVVTKK